MRKTARFDKTTSIKKQQLENSAHCDALKKAKRTIVRERSAHSEALQKFKGSIVRVLKTIESAEKSVRHKKSRLEDARLDVKVLRKRLIEAEYTSLNLSLDYGEIFDTSPIKRALAFARLRRSRAMSSLTEAKARLSMAKSELSAILS